MSDADNQASRPGVEDQVRPIGSRASFVDSPDLDQAIGHVVVRGARSDEMLSEMLSDMIGDRFTNLFDGHDTTWLLGAIRAVVKEIDPWFRDWPEVAQRDFLAVLSRIDKLRSFRNELVHGTWADWAVTDDSDPDLAILPRIWGGEAYPEGAFYCRKARRHNYFIERAYTIADVERLAREIEDAYTDLARRYRLAVEATEEKPRKVLPRW